MEINVSKSELAGALSALGKLVCRSSPETMYRSVKINGSDGKHLTFTVCSPDETLEYRIKTESEFDAIFAGIVPFEEFRLAVRNSKNKMLLFEQNNGTIMIDGKVMSYASCEWQEAVEVAKESALVTLPPNFVGMLAEAPPGGSPPPGSRATPKSIAPTGRHKRRAIVTILTVPFGHPHFAD